MERTYGKGLIGMKNPETGRIDPNRFGWDNRVTGGRPLGQSINVTVAPGLTIDASGSMAYWLGFVDGMKYTGLEREGDSLLASSEIVLTNCFASMYSLLTTIDTAAYNI